MKFLNWTTKSGALMLCAVCAFCLAPASSAAAATQPPASAGPGLADQSRPETPGTESDPSLTPDSATGSPAAPAPAIAARPVKARIAPRTARFGSKVAIFGRTGLGRRSRVTLLFRRNGGSGWHRLKRLHSNRKGRFRTRTRATASGRIRVEVKGNRDSAVRRLTVRSRLRVGQVRRFVNLGRKVRVGGRVLPSGVRRVTVRLAGADRRVVRTRTNGRGRFRFGWSPRRSGNFRMSVAVAGNRTAKGDRSRTIQLVGLRPTHASYYGPGLYGGALACGGSLSPSTRGVAHKTLPCGSKVTLRYGRRTVTTRVVDRGPYVAGREFDLTAATRNDLGFGDVGTVWTNR